MVAPGYRCCMTTKDHGYKTKGYITMGFPGREDDDNKNRSDENVVLE